MAQQKIKGDLIGLNINGVDVSCETSCEFSFEVDMRAASAIKSGRWKEVIPGVRSWQMSVNANMVLEAAGADATTVLNAVLTGEIMTLRFRTKDSILPEFVIVGEAYVASGGISASVATTATWNTTFIGSGPFTLGDVTLFLSQYGYRSADPFGDEASLDPQFSKRFPLGATELDFDFTKQSAGFYLFVILPIGQPDFNVWENSQFNFGNLPDYAWRAPYIYNDKVIIASRNPLFITSEISTIWFKVKNTQPGQFYFQDVVDAVRNTQYISSAVIITSVTEPVLAVATGGYIIINNGAQVTQGYVSAGDSLQAVNMSSSDFDTATGTVVTINGITDTFDVRTQPDETLFYAYRNQTFTRNNCASGMVGSNVVFSKTYTATGSQAAADALAAADTNFPVEGQAYANTNGTCAVASYYVWGVIEYENIEEYQGMFWADVFIYTYKGYSPTVPPSPVIADPEVTTVYDIPIQFTVTGANPAPPLDASTSIINTSKSRIVHPSSGFPALYPKMVISNSAETEHYRVVFTGLPSGAFKMLKQVTP